MVSTISTASRPKSVVNLITGLRLTEDVSLKGSPTVSPTTVAACSSVPLARMSTSTIFFALSQAPPAFAMKMAWKRPKKAMPIRYPMKNTGLKKGRPSDRQKTARKMYHMPFWA